MGLRRRSIRLRILLLILVPLLSLVGLYAFVAGITIGDATKAARLPSLRNSAGEPVVKFVAQLGSERRLAALYVARPTPQARAKLLAQESTTDKFRAAMDTALKSGATQSQAPQVEKEAIATLLRDSAGLHTTRATLLTSPRTPLDVINSYSVLSDDIHAYMTRLAQRVSQSGPAQLEAYGLFQLIMSLDAFSQEDALVEADTMAGSFSIADRSRFAELVALRRQYIEDSRRNVPNGLLASFDKYVSPSSNAALSSIEDTIIDNPTDGMPTTFDPAAWGKSVLGMSHGMAALVQVVAIHMTHGGATFAHRAYLRLGLAGGLGLLAVLASALISFWFGRGLLRQLATLRDSAMALATERLPRVMTRLRAGENVNVAEEDAPMAVTPDEIGQVGQAFNTVQRTAVEAAVDQARLRRGISDVFRNLARRSQSLLHRQLTLLDTMERRTSDPDELAELYRLDHLTTRMRRHAEGLIILSGAQVGRSWRNPVRLVDVLRAAVAEVEEYTRVSVVTMPQAALAGPAVADVIHMLAELVENATLFSPPNTPVRVAGDIVGNGFAVEIEDRGLGMSEDKLVEINYRLANPPEFDLSDSEQLGLFVAGRLAKRHSIKISLRTNAFGGSTAIVLIPSSLIVTGDVERRAVLAKPGDTGVLPAGGPHAAALPSTGTNGQRPPTNPVSTGQDLATGSAATASAAGPAPAPPSPGREFAPARPPAHADGVLDESVSYPPADDIPDTPVHSGGGRRDVAATSTRPSNDLEALSRELDWAPASATPPDPDAALPSPDVTESGLPRRVRQTSLAPELRTGTPHNHAAEPDVVGYRSPEQTRTLMSALQRGWEQGRSAAPPDGAEIGAGSALAHSRSALHEDENGADQ
jgi:signal transduction histidine kinase